MNRRHLAAAVPLILCLGLAPLVAAAADEEQSNQTPGTALPTTHRFTLTLVEGDETSDFSVTVASRNFSLSLGEKNVALTGRLWTLADGRDLLEYSLEYTQWVDLEEGGRQRRGSTWRGSAYLENGRPVEVVSFLSGSFSLRIDAID